MPEVHFIWNWQSNISPLRQNPVTWPYQVGDGSTGNETSVIKKVRLQIFRHLWSRGRFYGGLKHLEDLTLSLPRVQSSKLREKSMISCCKIVKNKQYHLNVLLNSQNSFHLNGQTVAYGFIHRPQSHLVQHNKLYHMKVLLNSFHLNGHTLGFHPQTKKLEPPRTA